MERLIDRSFVSLLLNEIPLRFLFSTLHYRKEMNLIPEQDCIDSLRSRGWIRKVSCVFKEGESIHPLQVREVVEREMPIVSFTSDCSPQEAKTYGCVDVLLNRSNGFCNFTANEWTIPPSQDQLQRLQFFLDNVPTDMILDEVYGRSLHMSSLMPYNIPEVELVDMLRGLGRIVRISTDIGPFPKKDDMTQEQADHLQRLLRAKIANDITPEVSGDGLIRFVEFIVRPVFNVHTGEHSVGRMIDLQWPDITYDQIERALGIPFDENKDNPTTNAPFVLDDESSLSYVHIQQNPSDKWIISHGFSSNSSVILYNDDNDQLIANSIDSHEGKMIIDFGGQFWSGKAVVIGTSKAVSPNDENDALLLVNGVGWYPEIPAPTPGDIYLVSLEDTEDQDKKPYGPWKTHSTELAVKTDDGWEFIEPEHDMSVIEVETADMYTYSVYTNKWTLTGAQSPPSPRPDLEAPFVGRRDGVIFIKSNGKIGINASFSKDDIHIDLHDKNTIGRVGANDVKILGSMTIDRKEDYNLTVSPGLKQISNQFSGPVDPAISGIEQGPFSIGCHVAKPNEPDQDLQEKRLDLVNLIEQVRCGLSPDSVMSEALDPGKVVQDRLIEGLFLEQEKEVFDRMTAKADEDLPRQFISQAMVNEAAEKISQMERSMIGMSKACVQTASKISKLFDIFSERMPLGMVGGEELKDFRKYVKDMERRLSEDDS